MHGRYFVAFLHRGNKLNHCVKYLPETPFISDMSHELHMCGTVLISTALFQKFSSTVELKLYLYCTNCEEFSPKIIL